MTEVDYYDLVRQKLEIGALYAPKHKKITDLLKVFWDEDEIKLLSSYWALELLRRYLINIGAKKDQDICCN